MNEADELKERIRLLEVQLHHAENSARLNSEKAADLAKEVAHQILERERERLENKKQLNDLWRFYNAAAAAAHDAKKKAHEDARAAKATWIHT